MDISGVSVNRGQGRVNVGGGTYNVNASNLKADSVTRKDGQTEVSNVKADDVSVMGLHLKDVSADKLSTRDGVKNPKVGGIDLNPQETFESVTNPETFLNARKTLAGVMAGNYKPELTSFEGEGVRADRIRTDEANLNGVTADRVKSEGDRFEADKVHVDSGNKGMIGFEDANIDRVSGNGDKLDLQNTRLGKVGLNTPWGLLGVPTNALDFVC